MKRNFIRMKSHIYKYIHICIHEYIYTSFKYFYILKITFFLWVPFYPLFIPLRCVEFGVELKEATVILTIGGQQINLYQQWKGWKPGKMYPSVRTTTAGFQYSCFCNSQGYQSATQWSHHTWQLSGLTLQYIRGGLHLFAHEILGKRKVRNLPFLSPSFMVSS